MTERPTLLFVSTQFLLPVDTGGKIRSTQVLRGMKGGRFRIKLALPATAELLAQYKAELDSLADEVVWWPLKPRSRLFYYTRLRHLLSALPIPVRTDYDSAALAVVRDALAQSPQVAVFDFLHAAVLAPEAVNAPTVLFTHNVEAEIFARHRKVAANTFMRALWSNQLRKMRAFEGASLKRFDMVVAVADRDSDAFVREYGASRSHVIPTGVDLEFFTYSKPQRDRQVVFCGSMDWLANQEAVAFFMDEIWARIVAEAPDAQMTVIGRSPPSSLIDRASRKGFSWKFTGFVDDVRPHVHGAAAFVIPLRVGGGTRLKVYEAMAMGAPVVSTTVGVEGLPVEPDRHYLRADDPPDFASAVVSLLRDAQRRTSISEQARRHVEDHFSYRVAASSFERACELAIARHAGGVA